MRVHKRGQINKMQLSAEMSHLQNCTVKILKEHCRYFAKKIQIIIIITINKKEIQNLNKKKKKRKKKKCKKMGIHGGRGSRGRRCGGVTCQPTTISCLKSFLIIKDLKHVVQFKKRGGAIF